MHAENSEVLPFGSVAVAVINCPGRLAFGMTNVKLPLQLESVVTLVEPRNVCPWP